MGGRLRRETFAPDKQLQTEGNIISVGIPAVVQSDNRQQLHIDKSIYLDPQEAAQLSFLFPSSSNRLMPFVLSATIVKSVHLQ